MAQRKVFVSTEEIELAATLNLGKLFLEIKDDERILSIFLDEADTADLIRELQKIKKQIAK